MINLVEGSSTLERKQVAHFKVAFVNSVPPNYICSLCSELFRFPCHVNCCQKHYCQGCIGRLKQMDRPCPNCSEKEFMVISDRTDSALKSSIDGLRVYCPMRKSGCKWTGKLDSLDDHLQWGEGECPNSTCRVVPVQCVSGCGVVIPRGSMKSHLNSSCKRRETSCKYCGMKESYDQLTTVHYSICPKYHVTCPNGCKMPGIQRSGLKAHLEVECPFRTVNCEFHFAGCGEELRGTDQSRHMNQAMSTHLSLLSTFVQSIQVENKELRSYCTRLEKVCASLQRDYARLATDFVDLQEKLSRNGHQRQVYQNGQKSNRPQRPLPPVPFGTSTTDPFETHVNQSYSVSSETSADSTPLSVPLPDLGGPKIDGASTLHTGSPIPPLPSRNMSLKRSSQLSGSSTEWLPNDSTDASDVISNGSYEEDPFN